MVIYKPNRSVCASDPSYRLVILVFGNMHSRKDMPPALVQRLGRRYAEQRLRVEADHEAQIFGQGINFFHFENWYTSEWLIRNTLRLIGLYRRGLKNATRVELRHNKLVLARLPSAFDGLTILHVSDCNPNSEAFARTRAWTFRGVSGYARNLEQTRPSFQNEAPG